MSLQIQFNSVQYSYDEFQEYYPELAMMIQSSLPQGKKSRRRKRKSKKTVGHLIDEIKEKL